MASNSQLTTYGGGAIEPLAQTMEKAQAIVDSGLFGDKFEKPAEVLATVLRGRELGLSDMQACTVLYPVNGQISMETKVMEALFKQAGHWFTILESSPNEVKGIVHLRDGREFEHTLTMAECNKARWSHYYHRNSREWKLKPTYAQMPEVMLTWRWKATAIRKYASEVLLGTLSREEVEDLPADTHEIEAQIELKRQEMRWLQEQVATLKEQKALLEDGDEMDGVEPIDQGPDDNGEDYVDGEATEIEDDGDNPGEDPVDWDDPEVRADFANTMQRLGLTDKEVFRALSEAADGVEIERVSDFPGDLGDAELALMQFVKRQAGRDEREPEPQAAMF